jgi:hypothetical protein
MRESLCATIPIPAAVRQTFGKTLQDNKIVTAAYFGAFRG